MSGETPRYLICRKFGAAMHLIAPTVGVTGMLKYVQQQLALHTDYWTPLQFENPDNPLTHVLTTGPEIWEQTGGDVDYFVAVRHPRPSDPSKLCVHALLRRCRRRMIRVLERLGLWLGVVSFLRGRIHA